MYKKSSSYLYEPVIYLSNCILCFKRRLFCSLWNFLWMCISCPNGVKKLLKQYISFCDWKVLLSYSGPCRGMRCNEVPKLKVSEQQERLSHHHRSWWNYINKMSMEKWWNGGKNRGNPEKNLPRPRFIYHQTHMEWPRRELGAPAVEGERLTACAMRPPHYENNIIDKLFLLILANPFRASSTSAFIVRQLLWLLCCACSLIESKQAILPNVNGTSFC